MFNEGGVMKGPGGKGKGSWAGREQIAEAAGKLLASDSPVLGPFQITWRVGVGLRTDDEA
jgi:hypothetical protein